jgi:hypothetical protein
MSRFKVERAEAKTAGSQAEACYGGKGITAPHLLKQGARKSRLKTG